VGKFAPELVYFYGMVVSGACDTRGNNCFPWQLRSPSHGPIVTDESISQRLTLVTHWLWLVLQGQCSMLAGRAGAPQRPHSTRNSSHLRSKFPPAAMWGLEVSAPAAIILCCFSTCRWQLCAQALVQRPLEGRLMGADVDRGSGAAEGAVIHGQNTML
jgi:hypothetical protein